MMVKVSLTEEEARAVRTVLRWRVANAMFPNGFEATLRRVMMKLTQQLHDRRAA